jgi:hypothetical protein
MDRCDSINRECLLSETLLISFCCLEVQFSIPPFSAIGSGSNEALSM